jgi:hypothetical protein
LVVEFPVRAVAFRGRLYAERRHGRIYVRIYVYMDFGGEELVQYVGKEVEGLLVVRE